MNTGFIRVLRVFRMVRVMRVIRVFRIFRELRKMTFSILACMASLMWALLLLFLIMFMFAIFFMQGAVGHLEASLADDAGYFPDIGSLRQWYPSLYGTMFSLLLAITGGVNWIEVVRPMNSIHWFYQVAFSFYILFVIFGVMNVLTGVFMESAAEFVDRDLMIQSQLASTERFVRELAELFMEFDPEGVGKASAASISAGLQSENVQAYLGANGLECIDVAAMLSSIDKEGAKEVTPQEFVLGMLKLRGIAKQADLSQTNAALNALHRKFNTLAVSKA